MDFKQYLSLYNSCVHYCFQADYIKTGIIAQQYRFFVNSNRKKTVIPREKPWNDHTCFYVQFLTCFKLQAMDQWKEIPMDRGTAPHSASAQASALPPEVLPRSDRLPERPDL